MLEIGFRSYDFCVADTLDSYIEEVHRYVPEAKLHFAPHKTIRKLKPWQEWDEEYAGAIREKLSESGLTIEVLGCTINPVHPDENIRHTEIDRFGKNLSLMKAFGASAVGTETGTWSYDFSYSPDTFEPSVYNIFLSSMDKMLNEAIKHDAVIGIEPAAYIHTICSPERLRKLLETFNDRHLMITFDPINLIPRCGLAESDGSYRRHPSEEAQRAYYEPLLSEFRDRISNLHGKDFKLTEEGAKKGNLTILTGVFDWKGFLNKAKNLNLNVPLMLENMNPETLKETVSTLNSYWDC